MGLQIKLQETLSITGMIAKQKTNKVTSLLGTPSYNSPAINSNCVKVMLSFC